MKSIELSLIDNLKQKLYKFIVDVIILLIERTEVSKTLARRIF